MFRNLGFEGVQTSFYWQEHGKMIRQLLRSERMSSYVDPRIARIPLSVCRNGHLAEKLINLWSRDTLVSDNVLGSGSPTPLGVEFLGGQISDSDLQGIVK